jgi:hypothetical protein
MGTLLHSHGLLLLDIKNREICIRRTGCKIDILMVQILISNWYYCKN